MSEEAQALEQILHKLDAILSEIRRPDEILKAIRKVESSVDSVTCEVASAARKS